MIERFKFTSILGWSVSRYDLFQVCKRKYYYNYYAKYDPDYPKQKIDILKRMTSIPLEIGNIVHDVNKTLLERLQRTEKPIDKGRFFEYARRKTCEYCDGSKVFAEVYYGKIKKIDIDLDVFEKVKISLDNFLNNNRFEWLLNEAVKSKAAWLIEPPGYGETRIDGMKAYCKVDFLFPLDDSFYIIDWKTGKPDNDKHRKQLIGYASWASFHFDKAPAKITPIIAYMRPEYKEIQLSVSESDVQEFSSRVKIDTEKMYEFCSNIEENIPKDKTVFTKTPNNLLCDYCNFRELCTQSSA